MELGGPDYSKAAPKVTDSQGREAAELSGVFLGGWWHRGSKGCLMLIHAARVKERTLG